jgi:copper chaperone
LFNLLYKIKGERKIIMAKKLTIEGMSCKHCVNHVETALKELEGVSSVQVDLKKGVADVELTTEISDDTFKNAIDEVGYTVVKIEG